MFATARSTGKAKSLPNVYREIGVLLSFIYFLVEWQASPVSALPGDIFAQLAFP
jgi:hypothetical protein